MDYENSVHVFLFFSFFLGSFLSISLVLSKRHRSLPNYFLAIFLASYAFRLLLSSRFSLGIGFGNFLVVAFVLAPSFYLYIVTITKKVKTFQRKFIWHFIPAALMLPILYFFRELWNIHSYDDIFSNSNALAIFSILQGILVVQIVVYFLVIVIKLHRYRTHITENFSNLSMINLNSITKLSYTFLFIIIIWIFGGYGDIGYFIKLWGEPSMYIAYAYWFLMSLTVLLIGYQGFTRPEIFLNLDTNFTVKPRKDVKFSQQELEKYSTQLLQLMDDQKPYLNATLKLSQLAELIQLNPVLVSTVINTCHKKNFNDFVNEYRVKEVISRMEKPESKNLTLLGIALESGFNSKSTFNVMFKKFTGKTPNVFKKGLTEKTKKISPTL